MARALVTFASVHGSTHGVADRLAEGLRRAGIATDVHAMSEVPDIAGYQAVVLGSAVHGGKWLPEAKEFTLHHAVELRDRMVWLFSVSTVGDEESMFPPRVAARMRAARKEHPELTALRTAVAARGHRNFAGVIARADWPLFGRAFFRLSGGRYGDARNWAAIDGWADALAREITAAAPAR